MSITRCRKVMSALKKVLAQSQPFSQDNPVLPIRVVYAGGKEKISEQMKFLRERDPQFSETDQEESELVEQFVDYLHKIHNNADAKYSSMKDAIQTVETFCEMYPVFKPKDFYIADAYDEKFPVDITDAGQQEIPLVTQPHQLTLPRSGVEPKVEI